MEFLRMFLSYMLVLVIIAIVMAVAIFIGTSLKKANNKKVAKEIDLNAEGSQTEN